MAMNHQGVEKTIPNTVKTGEKLREDEKKAEVCAQESPDLSLWWFSFPLIASTFGPIASAFSICGLVVPWRVGISSGGVEEQSHYIDDPKWVIGVNVTQLAIALLSNLFLYRYMAGRVRFSHAQAIAIIGWYASSIILTVLATVVVLSSRRTSSPDYAFTQAFYYTMFSTGLYFFIATIMVMMVVRHYNSHYDNKFNMTLSHRTLILETIGFLAYLLLGAVVFAHIEDWEYLDTVYWADCTILTVGLGDYAPITNLGRALLFPFAIGGIIILGLIISSIRRLVLDRGKFIMGARTAKKQQQRVFKAQRQNNQKQDGLTERQGLKQEFQLVRHAQDYVIKKRRWIALLISSSAWFILWLASAAVFKTTEEAQSWSYFESVYFAYVSLLTIGYGDFYPKSSAGKAFFVFWSLLAIPTLTILISNMGDTVAKEIRDVTLWLGNFTILPGEDDTKTTLERAASKFTSCIASWQRKHSVHMSQNSDLGSTSNTAPSLVPQVEEVGENNKSKVFLKSRKGLHYLLIKEIVKVMKHVNNSPPKKYTFEEWEWYLKLLGLAGLDICAYWIPPRGQMFDGEELGTTVSECGDRTRQEAKGRVKWSWVGNQSPLMQNLEEPEWLLEMLTKMLERELEIGQREELEQKDDLGQAGNVNERGTELSKD